MRPVLVIFSLLLVVVLLVALVQSIRNKFVNKDSHLWLFNLTLQWVLSLVLVICILRAEKHITAFEEKMRHTYGF